MTQNFTTSNFYLAAFLGASGAEMVEIQKTRSDKKSTFVFVDSPGLQKLVADFLVGNNVLVEVHCFIEKLKRLKSALYDY